MCTSHCDPFYKAYNWYYRSGGVKCLVCREGDQEIIITLCDEVPHYNIQSNHDHPPTCVKHVWVQLYRDRKWVFISLLTNTKSDVILELSNENNFRIYIGCILM